MDIKIKKVGNAVGTVGWLAKGFADGSITLQEGKMKDSGYHGLWLKCNDAPSHASTFLAGFNQFGLSETELAGSNKYSISDGYVNGGQWGTDAFWETLENIAQQWCDDCNAVLDEAEPLDIKVVRVEIAEEVAA